jgi:hypothetical protein
MDAQDRPGPSEVADRGHFVFGNGRWTVHWESAFSPWRLAMITVMQFAENLSDRQAADAV